MGASSEALKTWPAWFVFESMLSIVRTVTIALAGTVTVTGWGCGGAAVAAVVSGAGCAPGAVTASRVLAALETRLRLAGRAAGGAGSAGGASSGAACAVTRLIWSFTLVTPFS